MTQDILHVDDYNEIVDFVKMLKENNVDINTPLNSQRSNILQICCLYTIDTSIIKFLLEQGASATYKDIRGWTAVDYMSYNQLPYAQVLLWPVLKKIYRKEQKID